MITLADMLTRDALLWILFAKGMKIGLPSVGESGGDVDVVRSNELLALAVLLVASERSGGDIDMPTFPDDIERPRLPPNNGSVNLFRSSSGYRRREGM